MSPVTQAPNISPFRGLLYSPGKIVNLADVVAPPYDVIAPELQQRLYERHPFNIVRLILAKEVSAGGDRYQRAARDLHAWTREGILARDPAPAFYIYEQEFLAGEHRLKRRGFLGLCRLEPFGKRIRRHEETLSGPKEDRLRLIRSCRTNLSPIFCIYEDPSKEVAKLLGAVGRPAIDIVDEEQVCHRLWRLDDPATTRKISLRVSECPLLVADGHHRFETALTFRNEMRKEYPMAPADVSFEYVMTFFLEMQDPGLQIGPTHRILRRSGVVAASLLARLRERFEVESFRSEHPHEFLEALNTLPGRGFGMVLSRDNRFHVVRDPGKDYALDVLLVHECLFRQMLGVTAAEERDPDRLTYTKSAEEVFSIVQGGNDRLGLFLKPPSPREVFDLVKAGRVLPPKTTYFTPKLASGLVLHPLNHEERVI